MEKLFFITYDLRNQRNYQKLYDELRKLGALRMLESTWCVRLPDTVTTDGLGETLFSFVDNDDGLIVSEVSDWTSWNLKLTPNDLK